MGDVQAFIDRQLGFYYRYNYDNILKRLIVQSAESFHCLQYSSLSPSLEPDPPIFACRFAETTGYEHMLALTDENGWVAIQNTSKLNSTQLISKFLCHNNAVFDLAWMPGRMNFVTVSGDHTANLWDVQEGDPRRVLVFSNHTKSVKTAVFRPTEPSVFATGARDGHILVWDIRANNQPSVILKPDNCLMNCHSCFTPKTPGSHSKRSRIDNHRATSITGLVFQDDITLISCGECDGNIKVWDLRKNYNIYKKEPLPKHSIPYCGSSTKNGYTNLIIDDSRMRLYASCMDNVIYCFNISTYNALPEQRYMGHENSTFYLKSSLSPDSRYLISGSSDKNAYIWNVKCPEPLLKLTGHWAEVTCAAWCQVGDIKIVTCSDDARHKIWRIGPEALDVDELVLGGRAELVPRLATPVPTHWGADATPSSSRRRCTTPDVQSSRTKRHCPDRNANSERKTKRCLIDTMNAYRDCDDTEDAPKRLKLDKTLAHKADEKAQLLPAGVKRTADQISSNYNPVKKRCQEIPSTCNSHLFQFTPDTNSLSGTPTKKRSPEKYVETDVENSPPKRTIIKTSPNSSKVCVITFTTPTKNLPNYVLDGEAPHLRLMSPVKKKRESTNWLTRMTKEKKGKGTELSEKIIAPAPLSPRENLTVRRNSTSDRSAKLVTKTKPLLKYFSVTFKSK